MRALPFFDPDTREDILEHISGYVFDRATFAHSDEPMRTHHERRAYAAVYEALDRETRKRSVRR